MRGNPIFAPEATSTGSPVRRTSLPAHEATSTDPPVRRTSPTAHEVTSTDPPVRQNKPSCSRGDLDRLSRAPEQALLLTRRPRQALPCAELAFLLTRRVQVKLYLGGTASKASWRALPDCWPLMTGRPAAALHKAAGCSHGTEVVAGDAARILMASERGCTEAEELGPQFLCPVQGWQRAGTVPATAARPSPAAASHGRMLALT